jgi:hypothetical protein
VARLGHRDLQRDLRALDGLLEAQRDLGLEVAPLLRARHASGAAGATRRATRARGPARRTGWRGCPRTTRRRSLPRASRAARAAGAERVEAPAVVLAALVGIAQHVVGVLDLLEALLGLGVVRVASGWYWRTSLRWAFLISSVDAFLSTPRTL